MAGSAALAGEADLDNCRCRYFGEYYSLGSTVCIKTPAGMRIAYCSMNLNNTSWDITEESCPVTDLSPLSPHPRLAAAADRASD